jgi:hypothetical protein
MLDGTSTGNSATAAYIRRGPAANAVDGILLSVGWVGCPVATDAEIAACA